MLVESSEGKSGERDCRINRFSNDLCFRPFSARTLTFRSARPNSITAAAAAAVDIRTPAHTTVARRTGWKSALRGKNSSIFTGVYARVSTYEIEAITEFHKFFLSNFN